MLPEPELQEAIYRDGYYLDCRDWQAWLDLYTEDAVFWLPAWRDESELCSSPDSELSLMYYEGRAGLAERVWRANSGLSIASTPLPRTAHSVSNILSRQPAERDTASLVSSWNTQVFYPKTRKREVFFGLYEHDLRRDATGWRIARKKIVLMNDHIPTSLDFYCV